MKWLLERFGLGSIMSYAIVALLTGAVALGTVLVYKIDAGAAAREKVKQLEMVVSAYEMQSKMAETINKRQAELASQAAARVQEAEKRLAEVEDALERKIKEKPETDRVCFDRDIARRLRKL